MRGMRGTYGMFTRIPGNLLEDSGEFYYFNIPVNVQEHSGEFQQRFLGFKRILGNAQNYSAECSRRFRGMFKKIPRNLNLDLFFEILLIFYQILRLNCDKTKKYFLRYCLLLITNLLRLNTVFPPPFSFLFSFTCRGKGVITVRECRDIKKL